VFTTANNNTGAQPEFVFQATPIAYDPTNQFNVPGGNGNSQYTPNVKNDVRKATVTVTASSPSAINDGDNYPTITFTTDPSPVTWITEPTCGVYASDDTTYGSPLTGAATAGTYVTHCAAGTSARYTPTQANGVLTVNKLSVTVTASSPSAITEGSNYPTITFTTNPGLITWISQPTCAVYAGGDTTYSSALTGASTQGTYVTHCIGGTSARYTPTQANGSRTVNAAASVGPKLPSLANAIFYSSPASRAQYSPTYNVLDVYQAPYGAFYMWVKPAFVAVGVAQWPASPTGSHSYDDGFGGIETIYYSPDGVNYIPFP
jgi:hypothetical protein